MKSASMSQENQFLKKKREYLQRALVQDAELQVNVQSDLPLVEKFLQLNMRLFQLLEHRLHVDD